MALLHLFRMQEHRMHIDFYLKKRSEGKTHRVALSHVCKKLLRVIYKLETQNIQFDPSLLK